MSDLESTLKTRFVQTRLMVDSGNFSERTTMKRRWLIVKISRFNHRRSIFIVELTNGCPHNLFLLFPKGQPFYQRAFPLSIQRPIEEMLFVLTHSHRLDSRFYRWWLCQGIKISFVHRSDLSFGKHPVDFNEIVETAVVFGAVIDSNLSFSSRNLFPF